MLSGKYIKYVILLQRQSKSFFFNVYKINLGLTGNPPVENKCFKYYNITFK